MTEDREEDADPALKSPSAAFWLGFFLGPAGVFYASAGVGCGLMILAAILGFITIDSISRTAFGAGTGFMSIGMQLIGMIACGAVGHECAKGHNKAISDYREKLRRRERLLVLRQYNISVPTEISVEHRDLKDGRKVALFTLRTAYGTEARIINLGCRIVSIACPDRRGDSTGICYDFDNLDDFAERGGICNAVVNLQSRNSDGEVFDSLKSANRLWKAEIVDSESVRFESGPLGDEGCPSSFCAGSPKTSCGLTTRRPQPSRRHSIFCMPSVSTSIKTSAFKASQMRRSRSRSRSFCCRRRRMRRCLNRCRTPETSLRPPGRSGPLSIISITCFVLTPTGQGDLANCVTNTAAEPWMSPAPAWDSGHVPMKS